MYVGNLPPVSNRASWSFIQEIVDDETDEPVDISSYTITLEVVDPSCGSTALTASTTDGSITIIDTGTFRALFSRDDMADLTQKSYQVGVTIEDDEDTAQLIIGNLPVLDGIVSA